MESIVQIVEIVCNRILDFEIRNPKFSSMLSALCSLLTSYFPAKRILSRNIPPDDERMNVVSALVGVDGFQV